MRSIAIVIPTYNERENLPRLVQKLAALRISGLRILVVDDSSPDGTAAVARELAKKYPVQVLERPSKQGLGTAYVAGLKTVLAEKPDVVIQMDADLSHDPAAIPELLKKLETCDLVLGSRYVLGGRILNWHWLRRAISRTGNWYARTVLSLPYRDVTGGYKCFRRQVLEAIDLSRVRSDGYAFQIEMTFKAWKKGFRIKEIPIMFVDRRAGVSKMSRRIVREAAWMVWRLRLLDLLGAL
jgi:dolichol-phosphate mannosyltransferase